MAATLAMRRLASSFVLAPALFALTAAAPRSVQACGGTFCDNTQVPMPVDQRGEDILFVQDGPTIEVHIRIEYTGEAERFAWVLPLQAIPQEVAVGSAQLFANLSSATYPRWSTARSYECPEEDPNWGDDGGDGIKLDLAGGGDTGGGPEVVFTDVIGAFEVVVLQGGTAAEVIDFLDANDYAQDPDAAPILQEYLDEGFLFAAVKLAAGAEVDEIHPLVFRFPSEDPCVPLRLTRIAAEEDMGVRAYFLGNARWAPSNYPHVVLNPLASDWSLFTGPYLGLLAQAVDEAGGRAFATDYAGASEVVSQQGLYSPQWDETAFVGVDPIAAIDLIAQQGLNTHPMIQSLLLQYIPPPDGIDATDFWNNIADYADLIDQGAWDSAAFAADLAERIIEPGLHADQLLATWPYLTRLHTILSPAEMIEDPTFHAVPDLGDAIANVTVTQAQVLCGGDTIYDVRIDAESNPVCQPAGTDYPAFADMPAALRVEQLPMAGPAQVITDNSEVILASYQSQQAGVACMSTGGTGDTTDTGGTTTTSGGDDIGDDGTGEPSYDLPYDVSCGCSSDGRNTAPIGVALGLLVLALTWPRRRR